jgi:hypothetical protein
MNGSLLGGIVFWIYAIVGNSPGPARMRQSSLTSTAARSAKSAPPTGWDARCIQIGYLAMSALSVPGSINHASLPLWPSILSKLSSYYVLGEGRKNALPLDYERLDFFDHRQVGALVAPVSSVLDSKGLGRLHKEDLAHPLPTSYHGNFYTMISQSPWRHFDALFHWAD